MKQKEKQSWRPFFRVMGRNVTWAGYFIYFLATMFASSLTLRLPEVQGRIMAGEIFDSALISEFTMLTIASSLIAVVLSVFLLRLGYRTERNIQRSTWKKLIHLPMSLMDRQEPSSLISRVTNDTMQLTTFLASFFTVFYMAYMVVMMLVIIMGMSANIAMALLLALPYIFLVAIVPGRIKYRATARRQAALSSFTTFAAERLSNMRLVKSAGADDVDCRAGWLAAEETYKADIHFAVVDIIVQPFVYAAEAVIGAIILVSGGSMVRQGTLDLVSLLTIFMYGQQLYALMMQVVSAFLQLKEAQGATSVVGEILSASGEVIQREIPLSQADGDIVFEDVSFGYGEQAVLSHVDLTIPKGKVTAIVGPSGAGKSTLLSLLERLYTPDGGRIVRGGVQAEKIHLNEWRGAAGYIQQSSPLLSGTIRENIAYGLDREASEEEIIRAAKLANAYDFIAALPEGFDSDIGQLGGKLSGGQRQRIAIARMMIKNPDCLLLDEATSSLDAENEAEVQAAFTNMMQGRTAVVIAHNLRTIADADQIVVMDHGRVQAVGDHRSLYGENPLYKKYFDLQFTEQIRTEGSCL